MIQLIIDYLWHDGHACSEITESLVKLLGANQTIDGWNTKVTHLIRKTIKDSSTASFHKHEPMHFGYWSLLVEDILQIPCISQDLHAIRHRNVDVHSLDYFHKMALWQCCRQLCYLHLQHLVKVQLVLDCHCEVVHLTVDDFQDPVSGK
jgi:hypothetical protein